MDGVDYRDLRDMQKIHRVKTRTRQVELLESLDKEYTVIPVTSYHYRVQKDGSDLVMDIFPTGMKYHNLSKNLRGTYSNLKSFLKSFLKSVYEKHEQQKTRKEDNRA